MKYFWSILCISAGTDLVINAGTAYIAAMTEAGTGQLPGWGTVIVALIGGLVAGARTLQQGLKTLAAWAAKRGEVVPENGTS